MSIEVWDIVDENGVPTGRTAIRGRCMLKSGEYHLVVHIWIVSPDGKFLIQRRADSKKLMPGEWAATGGAAIAGENSFAAAGRELFEELGISSDKDKLIKLARIKRRNSILDIWVITSELPAERLALQRSEVAEAKWVTEAELRRMIEKGEFHNYGKEYFESVFKKIEKYRGAVI